MRRTLLPLSLVILLLASCSSEPDQGNGAEPTGARGTEDSSPTGITEADLVGTWTGEILQPSAPATWTSKLTLSDCSVGEPCGKMHVVTHNYGGSTKYDCVYDLTYEGFREDLQAFAFKETLRSGGCDYQLLLALTPLQDGATLGLEEYWDGAWGDYGVMRLSTAPATVMVGEPAAPAWGTG